MLLKGKLRWTHVTPNPLWCGLRRTHVHKHFTGGGAQCDHPHGARVTCVQSALSLFSMYSFYCFISFTFFNL